MWWLQNNITQNINSCQATSNKICTFDNQKISFSVGLSVVILAQVADNTKALTLPVSACQFLSDSHHNLLLLRCVR